MKSLKYILAIIVSTVLFSACEDDHRYLGSPYVKFGSYANVFYVEPDIVATFDIDVQLVGAPIDKDVVLQVNVLSDLSNARAGTDYSMPSTVTIQAGKNVGTLTVTGYYDGLKDGTQDIRTLVLELVGTNGVPSLKTPISASNNLGVNTCTLTLRGLCPYVPEDFEGTYEVYEQSGYETDPYDLYDVDVTLLSASNGIGTYEVMGLWGYTIPVTFEIDGRDPFNIKVNIPKQAYDTHAVYGQMWFEQRSEGTASACDLIINTNYKIYVDAGYFDQVIWSIWTKK
ncbi:MAG: hypothetical protein LBS69_10295 [Prevotellaceae bacterium]|jgi:hypothetical protein|nr:hypothetical protein [Prevotellaceae bacterium]